MARKKYIRDYRLVETVDERGRIRSDYEYIGEDYFYALGTDAVRREKRTHLVLIAVGWLAFFGALLPSAAATRTIYVALPFLFAAVPLCVMTDTLLSAAPDREPLQHRQADMLENRYPPAALWTAILPGAALVGELVRLLIGAEATGSDALFSLCAVILSAVGIMAFSRRRRFACRERQTTDTVNYSQSE